MSAAAIQKGKIDVATRFALGAGLALFMCAVAGSAFGWLLSQLIGGMYVTFLMPLLVGILLGGAAALPAKLFGMKDKGPLIAAVILGALICFAGEQIFAFLRFCEVFARQNPDLVKPDNLADPMAASVTFLERATGENGFWAYLSWVSDRDPTWSPIGMLGRGGIGVAGTIVVAIGQLAVLVTTGIASALLRTKALRRRGPARPTLQI